jgi:DNA-directed RNA polymerase subunit alpha
VRAYNCLKRAQIQNITDLLTYSKEDLLQMKNFGKKSADEVIEALQNKLGIGLSL